MPIHLLTEETIGKIAAGEVVERPDEAAPPGDVVEWRLSVTNTGTKPIDGVAVSFFGIDGFASESRYKNCTYDILGQLEACVFDRSLEPGRALCAVRIESRGVP